MKRGITSNAQPGLGRLSLCGVLTLVEAFMGLGDSFKDHLPFRQPSNKNTISVEGRIEI